MQKIGLLGGFDLDNNIWYYNNLCLSLVRQAHGVCGPEIVFESLDYVQLNQLLERADWEGILSLYRCAARNLERSGAQLCVICSELAHLIFDDIQEAVAIPLIHIGTAVSERLQHEGHKSVALIGDTFTVESTLYRHALSHAGISTIVPSAEDQDTLETLVHPSVRDFSRAAIDELTFSHILTGLQNSSPDAIVLTTPELSIYEHICTPEVSIYSSDRLHVSYVSELACMGL
ncbi:MAG: aspartate/glutamate racemase family protein [Spirochaetia bacterium]|nr:aspartate/glutamate racemase family protein [Spirochaetia bacterium]